MPESSADSRFDDTALNARPILVFLSNSVSPPTTMPTVIVTHTVYQVSVATPNVRALPDGNSRGNRRGSETPNDSGERTEHEKQAEGDDHERQVV